MLPIVPVQLQAPNGEKTIRVCGTIDTMCNRSVFPIQLAEYLEMDIADASKVNISLLNQTVESRLLPAQISLLGYDNQINATLGVSVVNFISQSPVVLLGMDFLSYFQMVFIAHEKIFVLQRYC